ncbi:MAG: prolyl-tRNA synthetase associated domain-containing protein [Bacteroidales bacterium]|nr:prolyl-tRNA synthetase associated domain-containing protein [Bacteroidales bacterium]
MQGQKELYDLLEKLNISFEYHEHPPAPTVTEAIEYWEEIDAGKCKNLFLRNHKGNRHYLVILEHRKELAMHDLEKMLHQGKLSLASEKRLQKYLGLTPGSVSPFGLINDTNHHVHLFIDENLKQPAKISFHPNINTATLVIRFEDFIRFLDYLGNTYEFLQLY